MDKKWIIARPGTKTPDAVALGKESLRAIAGIITLAARDGGMGEWVVRGERM